MRRASTRHRTQAQQRSKAAEAVAEERGGRLRRGGRPIMLNQVLSGRTRLSAIVAGAAVMALVVVDFVALGGERVAGAMVSVGSRQPGIFEVSRVGEEHLVEISTRRRMGQESKGRALEIRLEGPSGVVLFEESEILSRERRFFQFVAEEPGDHRLFLEKSMALLDSGGGNASVTVYVNDHRILRRFYSLMPF
jgi:hypothetical protein